jgi:hypothetical protein
VKNSTGRVWWTGKFNAICVVCGCARLQLHMRSARRCIFESTGLRDYSHSTLASPSPSLPITIIMTRLTSAKFACNRSGGRLAKGIIPWRVNIYGLDGKNPSKRSHKLSFFCQKGVHSIQSRKDFRSKESGFECAGHDNLGKKLQYAKGNFLCKESLTQKK